MQPTADTSADGKIKFSSKMKPIPVFEGKENCTYTVRVPRWYLAAGRAAGEGDASGLEDICRRRQVWGTDVYTDDSDVVAAAVHSGWIQGDFGEANTDLQAVCGNESEREDDEVDEPTSSTTMAIRPGRPVHPPPDHDAHITLLLLPPLESYASTTQHHIRSREWSMSPHDGMSFMIHRVEFVDEGAATRNSERGLKARKARLAAEEKSRREAADGIMKLSGCGGGRVGA